MEKSTWFWIFIALKVFLLIMVLNTAMSSLLDYNFINSLLGSTGEKLFNGLALVAAIAILVEPWVLDYKPRKKYERENY